MTPLFPARRLPALATSLLGLNAGPVAAAGGLANLNPAAGIDPQAAAAAAVKLESDRQAAEAEAKKSKKKGKGDDDDDDDDDKDDKDGDGDDESDEEDMHSSARPAVRNARKRERARIAAILNHEAAAANHDLAVSLALNSNMGRLAAGKQLAAAKPARGTTLDERMAPHAGRAAPLDQPSVTEAQQRQSVVDAVFNTHSVTARRKG